MDARDEDALKALEDADSEATAGGGPPFAGFECEPFAGSCVRLSDLKHSSASACDSVSSSTVAWYALFHRGDSGSARGGGGLEGSDVAGVSVANSGLSTTVSISCC